MLKWTLRIVGGLVALLVVAFLVFRTPDTVPEAMRAKYGAPPSQFVEIGNGLTIHLRDEGPREGLPLILLHGSNADLHTWQPWAERLRGSYRVIRYDQRGHGLTGPASGGDYATDSFAADVDAVADKLGLDRFVLVGNSMGGAIAARYAMLHPERLAGLVLVDAGGASIEREGSGNLAFTLARIPVVNKLAFAVMPRSIVEKSLRQSVAKQAIATPETVDRYWELARYPGNRDATMARFALGWQTFSPGQVAAIRTPTLVMWGEEDPLIPYEAAGWYMDHLPDARLVHYPGVGHIPMEEAPDRSAADLVRWLERLGS